METTTQYTTTTTDAATGAAIGAFFIGYLVFAIILYLALGYIMGKVFQKASKPFWAGFVPIYNGWVLFEVGGKPGWWVLLGLIPFVGPIIIFVLSIIVALEVAKRFGRSSAFGIIGLWLFSLIGYAILAFGDSKYQGVATQTELGVDPSLGQTPATSSSDTAAQNTAEAESTPPKKLVQ